MAGLYIDPNTGQRTDTYTPAPGGLPPLPAISSAAPASQPGNALTAGLATGYHEAIGQLGGFQEAAGQALGLPSLQEYGRGVAANRAVLADASRRPDLEGSWSPSGILYQVAKGVPAGAGMIGAGVAGAALAPEALAGAAAVGAGALAGYPLMVGGNVDASKQTSGGTLGEGEGARALAYGVPEAAIGAVGPGMLGKTLVGGVAREGLAKSIAGRAFLGAAETAPVMGVQSAVNTGIVQSAFGDPNMPAGDRARQIVSSFFEGGLQGAVFGAATHAISRNPNVPDDNLKTNVDQALGKAAPEPEQPLQLTDQRPQNPQITDQTEKPAGALTDQGARFEDTRPVAGDVETPPVDPAAQTTTDASGQMGFGGMSNEELVQARQALDRRASDTDRPISDMVDREMTNRTPPGVEPGEATLFTPEEMGARKPLNDALKTSALDGVTNDRARDFIDGLRSTNEPEMVNELSQAMADTPALKKTPWFRDLATKYGVMDDKGAPLDLDVLGDRLSTLQSDAEKLWGRSKREGDGPARMAQAKQQQARDVQSLIDLHTQADDLLTKARAEPDEPAQPAPAAEAPETPPAAETPPTEPAAPVAPDPAVASTIPDDVASQLTHWQDFEQRRTLSAPGVVTSTPEERANAASRITKRVATPQAEKGYISPDDAPRPRTQVDAVEMRSRAIETEDRQGSDRAVSAETAARNAALTETLRARLDTMANDTRLKPEDRAAARAGKMAVSNAKMQEIVSRIDAPAKRTVKATPRAKDAAPDQVGFADAHTADLNGETVFDNGDHALVRGVNEMGEPTYVAVDRASGERTATDITKASAPWLTTDVRNRLLTERGKAERADQAAFEKAPEGPFKTADSVTSSASVEPKYVQFVDDLMRGLGLGRIKTFLTTPGDMSAPGAAGQYGLNGSYRRALAAGLDDASGSTSAFGPGSKQFYVHFDPTMPEARIVETLAHEVGHIVYTTAERNAAPNVQANIDRAFDTYYAKTAGMSLADVIKMTKARATGEALTVGMDRNMLGSAAQRDYYRAKSEWFADGVARYATMDPEAPKPQTMIGKFFSGIADKIKSMIATLRGDTDTTPPDAIKDFLDNMRPDMTDTFMQADHGEEPSRQFDMRAPSDPGTTQQQESDHARFARSATVVNNGLGKVLKGIADGVNKPETLRGSVRRTAMGWTDTYRIGRLVRDLLPTVDNYLTAFRTRDVINDHLNLTGKVALDAATQLNAKEQAHLTNIVTANNRGMDVANRSWNDHPELHNLPDAAEYKAIFDAGKSSADALRSAGKLGIYNDLATANRTPWLANADYVMNAAARSLGDEIPGLGNAAAKDYQFANMQGDVQGTHDFMRKGVTDKIAALEKYRDALTGEAAGDKTKLNAISTKVRSLNDAISIGKDALATTSSTPYFTMGRHGDFMVSGYLKKNEDGTIHAPSARTVADRLATKGFGDVGIDTVGANGFFIRVADEDQMKSLHKEMVALQSEGMLDPASIARGRPDDMTTVIKGAPAIYQRIIADFQKNSTVDPEARDAIVQHMTRAMLDLVPPNSNRQFLQQRNGVQGYSRDPLQNFAFRQAASNKSLSNLVMSDETAQAFAGMREQNNALKRDTTKTTAQIGMAQDAINEFLARESTRDWRTHNNFLSALRGFTHSFQLGGSVGYALMEMSQMGTHVLPQLGAEFGYAKSSAAMAAAMPRALKVMKAVWESPHGWDMTIARDALIKSGVPAKDVDTVLMANNRGDLSVGAATRNLGNAGDGKTDTGLSWLERRVNVTAAATELFPRLVTALAAGDLHDARPVKGVERADFISHSVGEALQNWGSGNTARQTSAVGFAGQLTPVIAQFSSYQTQFLGKLYQEIGTAMGRVGTPEDAARSRRFLAGHLTAMAALSGTMGMPFATAAAGAIDKVGNFLTGKDDFDVEGSYRSFLADTFGKEASEVISKGLPRLAGIDTSEIGDQDLLPFTRLLADRRKFEDSVNDWAKEAMGSSFSLAVNAISGMRETMNGNALAGMQKMAPAVLRGPLEAFRMTENGYENSKGVKLPIAPSTQDILVRAIGLHPSDLAQEREKEDLYEGLKATKDFRRQQITARYERGISHGDADEVQAANQARVEFSQDHPQDAMALAHTFQSLPLQNLKETAIARATGMPLGVGMKDVETRNKLRF